MKICVTGATGFLGTHVVARLLRDGHRLTLQGARTTPPSAPGCRGFMTGPLETFTDWASLLEETDLVVNLAGRAHVMKETASDPTAAFRAANEISVLKLTGAMRQHGVSRLVHVSSIAAEVAGNAYGVSKRAGEAVIAEWLGKSNGAAVILRPPLIYGPEAPGNLARLIRLIRTKLPLPLASVDNSRSLLSAKNAADAIAVIAATDLPAGGSTFEICDDEQVSLPQIIRALSTGMGLPVRMFPFPAAILRKTSALVSPQLSEGLFGDLVLDNSLLKESFRWTPQVATLEGLEQMGRALARTAVHNRAHRPQ